MITPQTTAGLFQILSAAFPQWAPTGATIALFHQSLQDLDVSVVTEAVQAWVLTEERPPTIAGLRRKCAEVAGVLGKDSAEAWAEVTAVAEDIGYENYGNKPRPPWSSPIIREAVKAIGWWEICNGSNPTATRAQFIKIYEQYAIKHQKKLVSTMGFEGVNKLALGNSTVVELDNPQTGNTTQGGHTRV